jgi:hypothetical protein
MLTIFEYRHSYRASAKLISSTLESYNSLGGAVDIGALFLLMKKMMSIGVGNSKYRTQFSTYNGVREKLPLEIIAGVSQELENVPIRWHLTLETQQWNIAFSNQLELLLHLMENQPKRKFHL